MKLKLPVVLVLVAWLSSPAFADADRGLAAYQQGDYAAALSELRAAAQGGDSWAQVNLAHMYRQGEGIPKNGTEALRWYRAAAEQGHEDALWQLDHMYSTGRGVPRNLVLAYKWASLAAAQGSRWARENLEIYEKKMTPDQIAEAQRLAAEAWQRMQGRE